MIHFAKPHYLILGLITIVGLIFLFRKMQQLREQQLQKFAASHLLGKLCANVSAERRTVKKALVLAAIFCCFVALARPQHGSKWVEVKRKGIDILFAVDTSKSMLAEDVRPNRLQRAKFAILDFVGQLEGDRVGLMPFAGSAYLMCPLTIDYGAFESSLDAVNTTIIPKGGTDLAAAIREAGSVLSNEANHKILVFITDGENLQGDALKAAEKAAEEGMTIYTVGVGTQTGELIPLSRNGKTGFVKDKDGKFITSHLDETALTKIAEVTGGLYVPLGAGGEGLQTIYQEKLSLVPKEELAEKRHKVPLERFVWPLGAAIVLLMLEFVVSGRKSARSFKIPFIKTAGRRDKVTAALLLLFLLGSPLIHAARASEGEDAYRKGDYLTAAEFYDEALQKTPDDARLHFNYGTAAYKNNMYDEAAKAFQEALKSDDLALQEEAYFNRGNALFQQGSESVQTDAQHSMEMWQQALDSYDGALQLNSMNDDARFNQELVKRKLEELKKQQEEQDKQDQKNKDDKKDDKKQDKDKNKDQNGEQQDDQKGDQKGEQQQEDESGQQQDKQQGDQQKDKSGEQQDKQGDKQQNQGGQQDKDKQDQDSAAAGNGSQQDEEKQDSAAAENGKQKADEEKTGEASAAEKAAEQAEEQAKARDVRRHSMGKMTREEAKQLLNSLKDEEGELNFIPASGQGTADNQTIEKDW